MNRKTSLAAMAIFSLALLTVAAGAPTARAASQAPGGLIAFERGGSGLHVMNPDGSDVKALGANCGDPSWSPDGKFIACSTHGGAASELFVFELASGTSRQLTDNDFEDIWPAWSPDGSLIAYTSCGQPAGCQVMTIGADGSDPRILTDQDGREPSWSPDGSQLVFLSLRTGTRELYIMNSDGSEQRQITSNKRSEMQPAWSPDGARIAYQAVFNDAWEIAVNDLHGTEEQITFLGSLSTESPAWSPNGDQIVFSHDDNLYIMNADGSDMAQLTDSPTWDISPDWQPSPPRSRLLVRAYIDGRSQLVVRDGTAYWHHYDFAAPGRHFDAPGGNVPTYLNGEPWYPVWPGDPEDHVPSDPIDNEVRCGGCTTLDTFSSASLPEAKGFVSLDAFDARGDVSIVQHPTGSNDHTLIVEFNDNLPSGPAWYTISLTFATMRHYTPTNDAFVMQERPRESFGSWRRLSVSNARYDRNTYIKFNVHGLEGEVQQATLRLYVLNPGPDGGRVYATSPYYRGRTVYWLENKLRWYNAPRIVGEPVAAIGPVTRGSWVEVDVTPAVIAGLANYNGRVSLALRNRSANLVAYNSKEGAHPPELIVVAAP